MKTTSEGYTMLPPIDRERYTKIEGLEGPFMLRSGKVVYYDPREGKYYDRDSDMYMSDEDYLAHSEPRLTFHDSLNRVIQNILGNNLDDARAEVKHIVQEKSKRYVNEEYAIDFYRDPNPSEFYCVEWEEQAYDSEYDDYVPELYRMFVKAKDQYEAEDMAFDTEGVEEPSVYMVDSVPKGWKLTDVRAVNQPYHVELSKELAGEKEASAGKFLPSEDEIEHVPYEDDPVGVQPVASSDDMVPYKEDEPWNLPDDDDDDDEDDWFTQNRKS